MQRPDVDATLKPLKPFQRRTVEHAFHRLFTAPESTARCLGTVAVGLGKTLVPFVPSSLTLQIQHELFDLQG